MVGSAAPIRRAAATEDPAMSAIDQLLRNNQVHAASGYPGSRHREPRLGLAVVTCMDARLHVEAALGLGDGDAHVLRNAGGAVTEDVIRSLMVSQRLLGTRDIAVIHHTECGMLTLREDDLKARVERETGIRPPFTLEAFDDLERDVRQSLARIAASPFLTPDEVRGFIYELHSGYLREVSPDPIRRTPSGSATP
jgi:carbonic anhydrase